MAVAKKYGQNSNGYKLEAWVETLFKELGKPNVRRNITYRIKPLFGRPKKCQIDVEYGILSKTRIECKYVANGYAQAEAVEKFHRTKQLLGNGNYLIATNSDFSEDAENLAAQYKIGLLNGKTLAELKDSTLKSRIKQIAGISNKPLEEQIRQTNLSQENHYKKMQVLW